MSRQGRFRQGGDGRDRTAFAPGDIGGDDQRGNLSGRCASSDDGFRRVAADFGRSARSAQPLGIGPRNGFDVGGKRRVVMQMIGRMLADQVDDRHLRPAGIVQIREAVAEAGAEMK